MTTSLGGHISHIIETGLKADNKETVGIYATDGEAYTVFNQLFKPAIEFLHHYNPQTALFDLPDHRGIFKLPKNQKLLEKLLGIRFRYSRNLKGFPYLPHAKLNTKREINDKLLTGIKKVEATGFYYDLEQFFNKDDKEFDKLFNKFFDYEENLFTSLEMSKQYSGMYVSEDKKVGYLINFNDHLQIVVVNEESDFENSYKRLKNIHSVLEKELKFDFDEKDNYGYLTSCPSNIGMGLKLTSYLNIPNAIGQGNFLVLCKNWSLRFKKMLHQGEHKSETEIISKHKLGISEMSFINSYIVKICSLINLELNLLENSNYQEKSLDVNKMKDNLGSIYQHFFEKYKFLATPNLKSFNSIFKFDNTKNLYSVFIPDKESYIVFKDFIYDYIAGFANINMVDLTNTENRKKLKEKYTERVTKEQLQRFDEINNNYLKKITIIIRRNIKKHNFLNVLSQDKIKKMYQRFLTLSKDLKEQYGGTVIEANDISNLFNTQFKFIFEEFSQILKGQSKYI